MAVKIIKGDLLNCGADIICHQTNFFGMMGGGVSDHRLEISLG